MFPSRSAPLILFAALAACAAPVPAPAPGTAAPSAVTLYRDTVTVQMRDGAFCTAPRPGGAGPWRTRLGGCPHPWDVAVLRVPEGPRLRLSPTEGDPWLRLSPPDRAPLAFAPAPG